MRRQDKTVAMLRANMALEQRYSKKLNEELDNLDEGLKDKIKELFSGISDKIKEKLSNISISNITGIDKSMAEIDDVAGELQKNGINLEKGVSGNWDAIKALAEKQEPYIKEGAINEDFKDKLSNVLMGIGFSSAIIGGSVLTYANKTMNWWDKSLAVGKNFLGGHFNTNIVFGGLKITQWYWVIGIGCAVGIAAALYKYNRSGKYKKDRQAKARGNTSMRAVEHYDMKANEKTLNEFYRLSGAKSLIKEYTDNEQNMATLKSSQIAVGKIKQRGNENLDNNPIEVKSGEDTLTARFILSVKVPNEESAEAEVRLNMGDGKDWEIKVSNYKTVTDTLLSFGMKITKSGFQTIIGIVKSVIDASQSLDDVQKQEYFNNVVKHFREYIK